MRDVKAVVFDVGRVLVQWDLRCLFARLTDDPAEIEYVFDKVVTEAWHFRHDAGEPLAALVAERKALFPQYAHFIDAYATRFNETVPGPVAGTHAIVDELAEAGWPLFCITNFADPFWDEFYPQWPVLRHFREIVVSGKERLVKPDPAIFDLAERRFGHEAGEMLFIDDNPANIESAQELGWHVHYFADADGLRTDLAQRGILSA
jgi:2-haloacid dehalogenase